MHYVVLCKTGNFDNIITTRHKWLWTAKLFSKYLKMVGLDVFGILKVKH